MCNWFGIKTIVPQLAVHPTTCGEREMVDSKCTSEFKRTTDLRSAISWRRSLLLLQAILFSLECSVLTQSVRLRPARLIPLSKKTERACIFTTSNGKTDFQNTWAIL